MAEKEADECSNHFPGYSIPENRRHQFSDAYRKKLRALNSLRIIVDGKLVRRIVCDVDDEIEKFLCFVDKCVERKVMYGGNVAPVGLICTAFEYLVNARGHLLVFQGQIDDDLKCRHEDFLKMAAASLHSRSKALDSKAWEKFVAELWSAFTDQKKKTGEEKMLPVEKEKCLSKQAKEVDELKRSLAEMKKQCQKRQREGSEELERLKAEMITRDAHINSLTTAVQQLSAAHNVAVNQQTHTVAVKHYWERFGNPVLHKRNHWFYIDVIEKH